MKLRFWVGVEQQHLVCFFLRTKKKIEYGLSMMGHPSPRTWLNLFFSILSLNI
jgi:hypothetical protein